MPQQINRLFDKMESELRVRIADSAHYLVRGVLGFIQS